MNANDFNDAGNDGVEMTGPFTVWARMADGAGRVSNWTEVTVPIEVREDAQAHAAHLLNGMIARAVCVTTAGFHPHGFKIG